MAGNIQNKYGSNAQVLTITLASLTNTSARAGTAIDNSSNNFQDVLVFVKIKTGGSGTSATGYLAVYGVGSVDGGTTYTEGFAGTDASYTTSPPNSEPIGYINVAANSTTYYAGPFSVAQAFGGVLPDHWSIAIDNQTGGTLDSTAGNHYVKYQGVYTQYT